MSKASSYSLPENLSHPRTRGLIIVLVLSGLIGLWSTSNTLQSLDGLGFIFVWQFYTLVLINLLSLVSAGLISRYRRAGLVLGLITTCYTLYYAVLSLSTFMVGGLSGQDFGTVFGLITGIDIFLRLAVIYYLSRYLIARSDREHFF